MGRKAKTKTINSSLSTLKKKVWKEFSKYIRQKYADINGNVRCYTCGQIMPWQESQCGHGISGRGNAILFDEELCRPQCKRCNIFLYGNLDVFHTKLIKEKGIKWFEEKLKLKHTIKQFTRQELETLLDRYKELNKKM
ncbi:MAG: recombination protein NinG [Candidatus Anstonellales archaeon]